MRVQGFCDIPCLIHIFSQLGGLRLCYFLNFSAGKTSVQYVSGILWYFLLFEHDMHIKTHIASRKTTSFANHHFWSLC